MEKAVRALLLTDVVDSTKLVESLGEERAAEVWSAHDTAARKLLPEHRGLEIDKTDGFLMLFESGADAASYALAYHRALRDVSKELDVELAARAGIHVGEVVLRENPADEVALGAKPLEVEGLAKPTAARIMSLAVANQVLLSGSARDALGDELPDETELQSHGHWRLKGVSEPLHLHELGVRGESPFTPPPDAGKVHRVVERDGLWLPARDVPRSLPAEQDAFVGREAELQELALRFDEGARLLTVLGPGGTGKTRLVTRYAWAWLGEYPGGAWFCDLSEARSLEGIAHALAKTLDVPLGTGDPVVQLGHAIASRGECLIVLDNFEQVAEHAGATVGRWLERAHGAQFVVTSRVLLNLLAEAVMHVEPLAVDGAAIQLFELRARAKKPGFAVTAGNRAHVEVLVEMLDGLPLAIELAAARVRVMSPAKLVERMSDRFALLSGARGATQRQATLEAAIDWSWDLLEPWEKAALAQASVFAGGFKLESAEAVLDLSAWDDAPWPLDAVQALVDKSLLRTWTPDKLGRRHDIDEPYFGMYVSIHEYAAAKLRTEGGIADGASGPAAERAAHERHGEHFAALGTAEAMEALDTHGGVERRQALAGELENVVVACRRAVTRGDGATAVPTLHAAWAVLELKGPFGLGTVLARPVVALPELAALERARARFALGRALDASGETEEARACYEDALAVLRKVGSRRLEGTVVGKLGALHRSLGQLEEARACFEDALAIARELGDRRTEGLVLGYLGTAHACQGGQEEARAYLEGALAIHREVGNRRFEGDVVANIGVLHLQRGRMEEARACYEDSLAIHREVGNRRSEGIVVGNLGLIHLVQGRMEEARACYEDALAIARELGHRHLEGALFGRLGGLHLDQGRLEEAWACIEDALAIAREVGDRPGECLAVGDLGTFHSAHGRLEEARACYEDALAIAREVRDRGAEGLELGYLGNLHLAQGRMEEARVCLEAGEVLLRVVGDHVALARILCVRGRLEHRMGEVYAAHAALAEVESIATELGAGPDSELGRAIAKLREELADANDGDDETRDS